MDHAPHSTLCWLASLKSLAFSSIPFSAGTHGAQLFSVELADGAHTFPNLSKRALRGARRSQCGDWGLMRLPTRKGATPCRD